MRDKIIDYYKTLLSLGWLVSDEDGQISVQLGDELMPATINGKRMILPTREQMKNTNWDSRVGFHPLRESYNLGVSDVVAGLRDQFVQRLNTSISYLMKELISIAHDQEGQKNLTTEQAQVLNALPKCDDRTVKDFASLMKNTKSRNNADQFINIHIRRGGVVKGVTYGRAGIVKFPIYDQLKASKEPVNGVKLSVKDREMFIKLYEFIFPELVSDPEFFSVGVSSRSAPFLEALVRSALNVADALAEAAQPYMDKVDLPQILYFNPELGDWKEIFDSKDMVEQLARTIPPLNANEDGHLADLAKEKDLESPSREERRPAARDVPAAREPVREAAKPAPASTETVRGNMHRSSSGRMIMGSASPAPAGLGKATPDRSSAGNDRAVTAEREARSTTERERRELAERERQLRERELELDRQRREEERRERDERERERELDRRERERRDRDYRDRERERDRDYRDRDRRDDDRRDRRERTGDVFDDNPILREALRDEEDRGYRGRDRYSDRDRGNGRRVRDIRDRGRDRGYDRRDDDYYRRDRYRR